MRVNALDSNVWHTPLERVLDPVKGDMSEDHIRNVINYLQKDGVAYRYLKHDRLPYRWLPLKFYIRWRIKRSRIWKALHEGLRLHKKLKL